MDGAVTFFLPWVRADQKNMDRWAKLLIDVATTVYQIARGAVPNPQELLTVVTGWRLLSYFSVASNSFKALVCCGVLVAFLAVLRHLLALFVGTRETLALIVVQLVAAVAAIVALLLNTQGLTRPGLRPQVLVDQLLAMAAIKLDVGFGLTIVGLALIAVASLVDLVSVQRGTAS